MFQCTPSFSNARIPHVHFLYFLHHWQKNGNFTSISRTIYYFSCTLTIAYLFKYTLHFFNLHALWRRACKFPVDQVCCIVPHNMCFLSCNVSNKFQAAELSCWKIDLFLSLKVFHSIIINNSHWKHAHHAYMHISCQVHPSFYI